MLPRCFSLAFLAMVGPQVLVIDLDAHYGLPARTLFDDKQFGRAHQALARYVNDGSSSPFTFTAELQDHDGDLRHLSGEPRLVGRGADRSGDVGLVELLVGPGVDQQRSLGDPTSTARGASGIGVPSPRSAAPG